MRTGVAARYWPVLAGLAACALVVALFPTVEPGVGHHLRSTGSHELADTGTGPVVASVPGNGGSLDTSTTSATGGAGAKEASAHGAATTATAAITPPSSVGVARSGVRCAPGVRQVTWSVYAPACMATYHGYNGGATAHGVSADQIVLSYRRSNSTQDGALFALLGDATPGSDDQILADLRTYIDLFNRSYELYGRHVVLKDFQGQGDWLAELSGQGQPQAVADASTAHDVGAFADTTLYKGSPFYWSGLAQQHVITFCCYGYPMSVFQQASPYWYGLWLPEGTTEAKLTSALFCQRMAGMPAINAGDPAFQQRNRVFGFIAPDSPPPWAQSSDELEADMARCGVHFAKRAAYSVNFAEFQSEATSLVAQMHAAGVTTVLCWCDPVIPVFLTQAADQQQYRPEWFEHDWFEPTARLYASDQWRHALSLAHQWAPVSGREAAAVFGLASGGGAPREQYFDYLYQSLLQVFGALQAAGPDLNPVTFQRGLRAVPTSGRGEFGTFSFAPERFAPYQESQVSWWNPGATSGFDNKAGAWQSCEGGAWFPFLDPTAVGAAHTQLHCFGR